MPIYEYKCLECGSHLEKMQKISDAPLTICDQCGGKLEKQWSLSGFQFKGEGWYVTDYSGKKNENSGKSEKSGQKSSSGESTVGTESASNQTKDTASDSKKETVSKKE